MPPFVLHVSLHLSSLRSPFSNSDQFGLARLPVFIIFLQLKNNPCCRCKTIYYICNVIMDEDVLYLVNAFLVTSKEI